MLQGLLQGWLGNFGEQSIFPVAPSTHKNPKLIDA
jgi:hypothetical protein